MKTPEETASIVYEILKAKGISFQNSFLVLKIWYNTVLLRNVGGQELDGLGVCHGDTEKVSFFYA